MQSEKAVGIVSTGRALPVGRLTNFDLEHLVETSDKWIRERTGIEERRILSPGETNSGLSLTAAKIALERACLKPRDIDLILVATVTPDMIFPSTACLISPNLMPLMRRHLILLQVVQVSIRFMRRGTVY